MKVLVACEFSGRVRDAFRERGHEAWSCDIEEGEGTFKEFHLLGDVRGVLQAPWDLIVAFPPCTYLSTIRNRGFEYNWQVEARREAYEFVLEIWQAPCQRVVIENPVGRLSTMWRKPDQIIHPFYFGDPYEKMTCLWVRGVPLLEVEPEYYWSGARHPWCAIVKGSRRRSATFPGVAQAMARQWGGLKL